MKDKTCNREIRIIVPKKETHSTKAKQTTSQERSKEFLLSLSVITHSRFILFVLATAHTVQLRESSEANACNDSFLQTVEHLERLIKTRVQRKWKG